MQSLGYFLKKVPTISGVTISKVMDYELQQMGNFTIMQFQTRQPIRILGEADFLKLCDLV